MGCTCIAEVNATLASRNSVVVETWYPLQRPLIETAKLDSKKRGRPTPVIASFCPFCGNRYPSVAPSAPSGAH